MSEVTIKALSEIKPVQFKDYPRRILLIKTSSLGDVIHAFPAFILLRKSFPDAKIDWIINKNISQILDYVNEFVNDILIFDRQAFKPKFFFKEAKKLSKVVRKNQYDLVIDMQGLLRSSLICFLAKSATKVGFQNPREGIAKIFYNKKIKVSGNVYHAIERNTSLVSGFLNIKNIVPDFVIPSIDKYKNCANNKLREFNIDADKEKYIVISPGGRWKSKRWPTSFFSKISDGLYEKDNTIKFVIIGSSDEREIADKLLSECKNNNIISAVDRTNMIELVEILRNAKAVVTNDSGPMHIASAMRTPVFALFGPTDPVKTGPYWSNSKVYQNRSGCIKCLKRECFQKEQYCQQGIKAETIVDDLLKTIK